MIVYVESNFILELALEQKEAAAAKGILELAESGKIELAFPSLTLIEPFVTVMHLQSERRRLRNSSEVALKQLKQSELSELHNQVVSTLQPVLILLTKLWERELDLLHSTVERMLSVGKPIETDVISFRQALMYQRRFDLKPQDSIIYAAMVADLQRRTDDEVKCFLSRDREAFGDDPGIKSELASYNCRYIGSFADGLSYIQHAL